MSQQLLNQVMASLLKYRTILQQEGYSRSEITQHLLRLTLPNRPGSATTLADTHTQRTQSQASTQLSDQQIVKNLLLTYLKSHSSISAALTQLLAEIQYRTIAFSHNNEDTTAQPHQTTQIAPQKTQEAQTRRHQTKNTHQDRQKKQKKKRSAKHNSSKVRAIDQLQLQAQTDNNATSELRIEPNLAEIKALQKYLQLRLMEGQFGLQALGMLQRELQDAAFQSATRPLMVFNL